MNIIVSKVTFGLFVINFVLSHPVYAETLVDNVSQTYFDDILKECDVQLNEWQRLWAIEVGLAFLVLVLGAVSAAIQNFNFQSVKAITVICGSVITITTGFINLVGWDDYRTLDKSIAKVQSITRNMNRAKRDYVAFKESDKHVPLEEFGKLYAEFKKTQEPPPDKIAKYTGFGYEIINAAYADDLPTWIRTVPEDTRNLYFVGVADSTKLEDAKASAKDNAIQNATIFLSKTLNTNDDQRLDTNSLTLSLIKTAEDADNYISFDEKSGIYRYYSLIGINKSLAEAEVKLFAVQRGINAPANTIQALAGAQRARDDYTAKQLVQTEALLNKTSAMLSEDEFRNFSNARELRKKKKNYDEAIALLNEILVKKPEFYLGWYNLALALDASGKKEAARTAYERSIALEPTQPLRDGTVYNAFGDLLLKRKFYCDAISQFKIAIELDQNNPRAQNNLKQATQQLQDAGVICK